MALITLVEKNKNLTILGSVAEWSKALVLKTSVGKPTVSSNLTASAKLYCASGV